MLGAVGGCRGATSQLYAAFPRCVRGARSCGCFGKYCGTPLGSPAGCAGSLHTPSPMFCVFFIAHVHPPVCIPRPLPRTPGVRLLPSVPRGGHVSRDTEDTPSAGTPPSPRPSHPAQRGHLHPPGPPRRGVGSTHIPPPRTPRCERRWEPGSGGGEGAVVRRGLRGGSGEHRDVRRAAALTFTSPLSPRQPPHVSH